MGLIHTVNMNHQEEQLTSINSIELL
jgi:hypothetical protein